MGHQINLRLPDTLFDKAAEFSEGHGYSSVQEFIKEVLREKLFDKEDISREELELVRKLVKVSEEKGLYGTEEDLFDKL